MSEAKRLAGEKAIEYVRDGMIVGVGTGSTVAFFIDALARIKADTRLEDMVLVSNSRLSVQPVAEREFERVLELVGEKGA